ncbi:hypothetical protein CTI12_AA444870 [Artemisia annua]|uniref:DNA-binding pseudobarrel domain-containing protein n=1 Tax=Artemisia annua TaxID=35608 RepID=A0A2U1LW01_ARTAN|nr:hypothetical protein CTI12_AA444870 [Artemisia annua]
MDQQFLFPFDVNNNPNNQILPRVFNEFFYNGETYVFLNGNNRQRYICLLMVDGDDIKLYKDEWARFLEDNVPPHVTTLHFVKEAESTFYVTGYSNLGVEGPGYDRRTVGNRLSRCLVRCTHGGQILPGDFLQDIWKDVFKIYANGLRFRVMHERVQLNIQSVVRSNRLFGYGWEQLVIALEIAEEQLMVFTNLGDNKLNLALFFNNGRCMHEELVFPTMLRIPPRPIAAYALHDKRAKHICSWKAHNSHINENDVFYAELDGTVTEFYHLTVPKEYCEVHMMHTYGKALLVHNQEVVSVNVKVIQDRTRPGRINHVKITGNWKKFAGRCGFILGKMMRLKLINTIVEMVEGEEIQVAVFHVC